MGAELARRVGSALAPDPFSSRRPPMAVVRAVESVNHRAVVAAAKVESAGFVTHVALLEVESLTNEEARAIERCPLGEPRYRALVDTYAGLAANEIARLSY